MQSGKTPHLAPISFQLGPLFDGPEGSIVSKTAISTGWKQSPSSDAMIVRCSINSLRDNACWHLVGTNDSKKG